MKELKLIGADTRALVQGITGSQGRFHTKLMLEYGTKIVAGVTPGRGGDETEGVPVYDTIAEAKECHKIDASIIFVPARFAFDAMLEAIDAQLDPVVVITEGVPIKDTIKAIAKAGQSGITLVGPNGPGLIKPGESKLGIMPAQVFQRGCIGVVSRSGTLFYEIASHITRQGLGQSMCVGIGGDPVAGLNFIDVYNRTGLYPLPALPGTPGMEGAGIVEEIGEGVVEVGVGDRVAYAGLPPGAYAEIRLIPAHRLVRLPESISFQQGAAMMLKGMTARYLLRGCYHVKADLFIGGSRSGPSRS